MASQQASKSPGIDFYGSYQVYSDSGVDLTLLRENLKRTVEERFEHNRRFLELIHELQQPVERSRTTAKDKPKMSLLDPAAILRQLNEHHVDYVLIGGLALIAHGAAYITKDLDICYGRNEENFAALVNALSAFHPYLRGVPPGLPFRLDVPTMRAGLNFTLTTDLGDIDLLGEVSGVGGYEQALEKSIEKRVQDLPVRVLSIDGLIAAKKAAARPRDLDHLRTLEELKKAQEAQG